MQKILKELLEKEDKSITCAEKFLVTDIKFDNEKDWIILELQQKHTTYKDIVMIKGNTFPIPKVNRILFVNKIFLKYSQEFNLKLFIEGNFDEKSEKQKLVESKKDYSFDHSSIYQTISELAEIDIPKINSNIFRIISAFEDNKLTIKSILDSKIYSVEIKHNQNNNFKSNEFLWICNYELEQNNIKSNKMTTFEIFDDYKLINYLDNYTEGKNILFQVVDIDKENIILYNKNQNIYKLKKQNAGNEVLSFCTTLIISNFIIKSGNEIELTNESFFYKFKIETYYIENIIINLISILELHFLDFNKYNNKYDCIMSPMFDGKKIIKNNIEYLFFDSVSRKKYEYYPINLTLSNSKDDNIKNTFTLHLYPALINKINAFINTKDKKLYFFEYFYYNISDTLGEVEKEIIVDNKKYNIIINDNFGSENRKRISIINIPFQKMEVLENELKSNSLKICELINHDVHKIIGIYDISNEFKDNEISNDFFDQYYEHFGDIYDKMQLPYHPNLNKNLETLKNKVVIYNNLYFKYELTNTNLFYESMTFSQFKAWFGLIICFYANKCIIKNKEISDFIQEVNHILDKILGKNLKYKEIIRIIIYLINKKIFNELYNEIKFVSELQSNSPFALAYEFNKNQIRQLNEFSALFQAYLQLDSYIEYNYIHSDYTHSFSLECVFMLKYQLLSTYENFFCIIKENNNLYAFIDYDTKITVINTLTSFGENFHESDLLNNEVKAKNYAMPLSLYFTHEKSGHYKYSLKNKGFNCPLIYYRGLKIEIEIGQFIKGGNYYGESGRIIENFICKDKTIIHELSSNFIFGEFFSNEYFNGRDFSKLIKAVKLKLKDIELIKEASMRNQIHNIIQSEDNNVGENEENLNLLSYIRVGDITLNLSTIRRESSMTEKEKKERDEEYLLKRKSIIKNLKKRKKDDEKQ